MTKTQIIKDLQLRVNDLMVQPAVQDKDWICTDGRFLIKGAKAITLLDKLGIDYLKPDKIIDAEKESQSDGDKDIDSCINAVRCVLVSSKFQLEPMVFPKWKQVLPDLEKCSKAWLTNVVFSPQDKYLRVIEDEYKTKITMSEGYYQVFRNLFAMGYDLEGYELYSAGTVSAQVCLYDPSYALEQNEDMIIFMPIRSEVELEFMHRPKITYAKSEVVDFSAEEKNNSDSEEDAEPIEETDTEQREEKQKLPAVPEEEVDNFLESLKE